MLLRMMSLFICLHLLRYVSKDDVTICLHVLRYVAKDDVTIYFSTSIKVCC